MSEENFCEDCFYINDDEDYCHLFDIEVDPSRTDDCDEKQIIVEGELEWENG